MRNLSYHPWLTVTPYPTCYLSPKHISAMIWISFSVNFSIPTAVAIKVIILIAICWALILCQALCLHHWSLDPFSFMRRGVTYPTPPSFILKYDLFFFTLNFLFWSNCRCTSSCETVKRDTMYLYPVSNGNISKTIVQYHNQDTDNDTVKVQDISITTCSFILPLL